METKIVKEFENAYIENSEALFRFCYFRISDRSRAKEIMQDTFTQTWQYIVSGNSVENLRAFLYKVARNLVINELERRKQSISLETMHEEGFDPEDSNEENTEEKSEGRRILDFIKNLEDDDREILIMRYVNEMSLKEIADILEITPNNATVRLHRSTTKLKNMYNIENQNEKL